MSTLATIVERAVLDAINGGMGGTGGVQPHAVVRLLRDGDVLPSAFDVGFDKLNAIDPNWCWIVERNSVLEGCLLASPCHGTAVIWRLAMIPGTSASSLLKLLRTFMRDMRRRGISGYITFVDENEPTQRKLKSLMERIGAKVGAKNWTLMASPIPREGV